VTPALQELLQTAIDAALAASVCIRKYFGSAEFGLREKQDGSPVTLADQEAEAVIRRHQHHEWLVEQRLRDHVRLGEWLRDEKGGITTRVVGPWPRYAVRELMFLNVYPPSTPNRWLLILPTITCASIRSPPNCSPISSMSARPGPAVSSAPPVTFRGY